MRLQIVQVGFASIFLAELSTDLFQPPIQVVDLCFEILAPFGSFFTVLLPNFQSQQASQDALAVAGALLGELIGFALQEEGGIGKGLVIHTQRLFQAGLGLAHGTLGERLPNRTLPVHSMLQDMEFQERALAARQAALHPVGAVLVFELKSDLGGFDLGMAVDQRVVSLARLPEQSPGNGIQQRGFPRSVLSGDASQVKSGEVNLHRVAVR